MLCKKCGCAMRIQRAWYSVTGDASPDERTQVFSNAKLCCVNPKCSERGKTVETARPVEFEPADGKEKA